MFAEIVGQGYNKRIIFHYKSGFIKAFHKEDKKKEKTDLVF